MGGLGGFAPLPLRLGGDPLEAITAEQWARLTADMVACTATVPFAVIACNTNSTTVTAYEGQHAGGVAAAPTITINAAGDITLEWDTAYEDDHEGSAAAGIVAADAQVMTYQALGPKMFATAEVVAPNKVRVRSRSTAGGALATSNVFVVVY